jgi:hypothetical protein
MILWIFLTIILIALGVALTIYRNIHTTTVEQKIAEAKSSEYKQYTPIELVEYRENNQFPVPTFITRGLYIAAVVSLLAGSFNSVMFYAEPGYTYYIKTITGEEKVASTVGWHSHFFGEYTPWKQAATIQARAISDNDDNAIQVTSNQGPIGIMFLDQVDSKASAMARFILPTDKTLFLNIVHSYRSFDNLVNGVFSTSFSETLIETA